MSDPVFIFSKGTIQRLKGYRKDEQEGLWFLVETSETKEGWVCQTALEKEPNFVSLRKTVVYPAKTVEVGVHMVQWYSAGGNLGSVERWDKAPVGFWEGGRQKRK